MGLIHDEFCGNFLTDCTPATLTLWRLEGRLARCEITAGTISIYTEQLCDGDCQCRALLKFKSGHPVNIPLVKGNTISLTATDLTSLSLQCSGSPGSRSGAKGRYCISLHYQHPVLHDGDDE